MHHALLLVFCYKSPKMYKNVTKVNENPQTLSTPDYVPGPALFQ